MNNKTQSFREKGRALFLAAIMVLSVVAVSATAFTGAVAAQNIGNFQDQAVGQDSGGNPIVVVEGVQSSQDTTVIITYEDGNGDLIIAGLEELTAAEADGSDYAIQVEDLGGFPGEHTAHVVDSGQTSTNYEIGDVVSSSTANAISDQSTAVVYDGAVSISNQAYEFGEDPVQVTVDSSRLIPNQEGSASEGYVIALHDASTNDIIGVSDVVTSDSASNTVVEVDNADLSGEDQVFAMLHYADSSQSDNLGSPVPQAQEGSGGTGALQTTGSFAPLTSPSVATLSRTQQGDNVFVDGNIGDDQLNPIDVDAANVTVTITALAANTDGLSSDVVVVDEVEITNSTAGADDFDNLASQNSFVDSAGYVPTASDQRDEYFIELPVFQSGGEAQYRFDVEADGFKSFDGRTVQLAVGEQDTQDFRLTRIINAGEIDIVQDQEAALADGNDQITFDVSVFDDLNGDQFENAQVEVSVDAEQTDSAVTVDPVDPNQPSFSGSTTTTVDTDQNGTVTLQTSSDVIQEVDYTFTAASNDSVSQTRSKSFIISGEAELQGHVYNKATTDPVEDASVWLVSASRYERNQHSVAVDLGALENAYPNVDGTEADIAFDRAVFRLIDNETKEVIENQNYDVRESEYLPAQVVGSQGHSSENYDDLRKVEAMNTSDLRQGNGFVVIDDNENGLLQFNLTGVEPGEYALDVSLTAGNLSDQRVLAGETAPENFTRITGTDSLPNKEFDDRDSVTSSTQFSDPADIQVPTDTLDTTTPAVRTVSENLTLLNAIERAEASDTGGFPGANIVDSPGFTNSFGEATDGTSPSGSYALNRIYSQFQDGVQYVAIASKPGFDADFQDVYVTEDHKLTFEESQNSDDFQIEPIDPQPDFVNITNWGLHPPLDQTGGAPDPSQIVEYDNKTDAFNQTVPRDESVDVILVETGDQATGTNLNATVDLQVPDDDQSATPNKAYNFTGQIVGVLGGEKVSNGSSGDIGTFHTGDTASIGGMNLGEGEAVVLLESDESSSDLLRQDAVNNNGNQNGPNEAPSNETGVFAQLTNDASANDFSRKDFVGVIVFNTGEMQGTVRDDQQRPVDSRVWLRSIVTPSVGTDNFGIVRNGADDYTVQRLDATTNNVVATDDNVTASELESYDFSAFPGVSTTTTEGLTLLTDTFPGADTDYALPRVPTVGPEPAAGTTEPETEYNVRARADVSGETGTSALRGTNTNQTGEANINIDEALAASLSLSNLSPATATASPGDQLTISADVTNNGDITATETANLTVGGTVVASTDVTVGAGETETAEFTITVPDLAAGDYTHAIEAGGDSVEGTLTIEGDDGDIPDWAEPYVDEDGIATLDGALQAIDDYESGSLSLDRVLWVIDSYENDTPIQDVIDS